MTAPAWMLHDARPGAFHGCICSMRLSSARQATVPIGHAQPVLSETSEHLFEVVASISYCMMRRTHNAATQSVSTCKGTGLHQKATCQEEGCLCHSRDLQSAMMQCMLLPHVSSLLSTACQTFNVLITPFNACKVMAVQS